MVGGYMGKYLLIDLSNRSIEIFDFSENDKRDYIGGYGLGCKFIYKNQKPKTNALNEESIMGFLTGPMNGIAFPGCARFSVCGKSPLTGTWGDANVGGSIAPMVKKAGFDGLFIKGISATPVSILLSYGEATIIGADNIWGKDTYETEDILKKEYGSKAEIFCIGPAGEKISLVSGICNRKGRFAARSGLGALMGSKKIKSLIAIGDMKVPVSNEEDLLRIKRQFIKDIKEGYGDASWATTGGTPTVTFSSLEEQDSPIKNWSGALEDMPDYSELNYDNIKSYVIKREGCYACPIACWGLTMVDKGPYALQEPSHTPEYETGAVFGALCLNSNYESIIKANDICNRYGLDTISTGTIVAFAIDCYENGILNVKDTDGLKLTWGNHDSIVKLVEKIAKREGIGDLLADGVKIAAEKIGSGSEKIAMHIGGQELPAHDTRYDPSLSIIYTFDPTPSRHTQAYQNLGHKDFDKVFKGVDFSVTAGGERSRFNGRAKSIKIQSDLIHTINAMGACIFSYGCTDVTNHAGYLSAVTGWNIDINEFCKIGERLMNLRLAFNLREGINPLNYKIPNEMLGIPPIKSGKTADITIDFELMKKEYFEEMNWDLNTCKPSQKKLQELNLDWLIKDLY